MKLQQIYNVYVKYEIDVDDAIKKLKNSKLLVEIDGYFITLAVEENSNVMAESSIIEYLCDEKSKVSLVKSKKICEDANRKGYRFGIDDLIRFEDIQI